MVTNGQLQEEKFFHNVLYEILLTCFIFEDKPKPIAKETATNISSHNRKNSNELHLFQGKQNVNLVFCGHVDAGKSTTVGHLLLKLGQFDQREFENIQRLSERNGRASWSYAYIMDTREDVTT